MAVNLTIGRGFRTGSSVRPTILIIGLGNPILGDDGVGWRVAEQITRRLAGEQHSRNSKNIEVDQLAIGGLALMERLIGYEQVILVDAVTTGRSPEGSVSRFLLSELPNRAVGHLGSAHDTTLHNALAIGRAIGAELPDDIQIVGIEIQQVFDFGESLSPNISTAVNRAADMVMELIK